MEIGYYFDHNASERIARGLERRGVRVVRARDDGFEERADPEILDRATELGLVVFTTDADFYDIATKRYRLHPDVFPSFAGVLYVEQQTLTIGQAIEALELIARVVERDELRGRVAPLSEFY